MEYKVEDQTNCQFLPVLGESFSISLKDNKSIFVQYNFHNSTPITLLRNDALK